MTLILIEFIIVLAGLGATVILFYRFPRLPDIQSDSPDFPPVSVIIPARNEEKNLPLLLSDLSRQTIPAFEIICVDDSSEDSTAQVALAHGIKLVSPGAKPEGWTGKTWACQNGAEAAKGELLLFLDADVRLGPDGIRTLLQAYSKEKSTISVQPYHKTEKGYEQLSMIFNFVQIAANGTALPKPCCVGLFGPVILIPGQDYRAAGGHRSIRGSIVEDLSFGRQLKRKGLTYRLFIGNPNISYRMYGSGLRDLLQGWIKNMAAGAASIPAPVFLLVFLWIASLLSVPLQIVKFSIAVNWSWLIVYSFLYIVWVCLLAILASRIGRFQAWAFLLFPILMLTLLGVFVVSAFKKLFGLKVTWKGRAIEMGDKSCE